MSTEQMKEDIQAELGGDPETNEPEQIENQQSDGDQDEPEFTAEEQKAHGRGWRPKDEYNGDEREWRTAKQFNEHGELVGRVMQQNDQIKSMRNNFDERLNNATIMHKGMLDIQMKELDRQFKDAVEDRDEDRASDIRDQQVSVSSQIEKASIPQVQQPNNDSQVQSQWESDNPWIYTNTDKASVAKGVFDSAFKMGKSTSEALEMVEKAIAPYSQAPSNRNRNAPASVASGNASNRNKKERSLSMNDVTHAENQMRGMFKDDKSFLKAVQDSRVGA